MNTKAVLNHIACALCLSLAVTAQEQKVKPQDVPEPARGAAVKAYPKARIKGWEKEVKDGKTSYEVTMSEGAAKWQAVYDADGTFVAREEVIPVASLPAAVRAAVTAKYPKAALTAAEKVTRPSGTEYEVALKKAPKKEITLTADGKILSEE